MPAPIAARRAIPSRSATRRCGRWAPRPTADSRGRAEADAFAIGPTVTAPSNSSMNGVVTETGPDPHRVHVGRQSHHHRDRPDARDRRRAVHEMQMITGTSLLVTHWAYMAPYNPAVFTPPSPTQYVSADITSPVWRWTAGTTWQLRSPDVFGTATPARSRSTATATAITGASARRRSTASSATSPCWAR